ncbi:hypothetical protein KIP88_15555 [Bradyrhizobium sp. SRL28]|uniref:hypothetical protein n=1 Tax=Bradyrhizobium sp. SRL28 TaxID=2836178 RepID=UPI001BDF0FBF|nr:hypothetical protein [Bradyrhizobium sp. SRL28]MBT1511924.1 hypothetical protein [Bradyrhizobium sp. SRL28]
MQRKIFLRPPKATEARSPRHSQSNGRREAGLAQNNGRRKAGLCPKQKAGMKPAFVVSI